MKCARRIGAYFLGRSVSPVKNFVKLGRGHLLLAALSGLALALAHPGWRFGVGSGPAGGLSFLVWFGLIPFFWSFKILAPKDSRFYWRKFFTLGFAAGFIYFLLVLRWLWSVYPLDTLGVQSKIAPFFIVFIIWIISAAGMAVFWGLFGLGYGLLAIGYSQKFLQKLSAINYQLSAAGLFVLLEYLRSCGFGVLWAGSGSLFGPHWTMGNFAYSLAGNSLARWLVPHIGIYGITFLVVLVGLAIFKILLFARATLAWQGRAWQGRSLGQRSLGQLWLISIIIVSVSIIGVFNFQSGSSGKEIKFAIIQTSSPTRLAPSPQEVLINFKQELEIFKRVAREHLETQIIVFPEASDFFKNLSLFMTSAQVENFFKNLFPNPTLVIAGGRIVDPKTRLVYSRAFSLDSQGDIISFYDKRLLTPGGEFLPYPLRFLTNLVSRSTVSQFGEFRELAIGQKDISTVGFRYQFNVAPIICSEYWSPGLAAKTIQNSDIIVGMSSYGVFRGNLNIVRQNLAAASLRAAENRKPMLVASNMGFSYALDSHGNILKITPNSAPQLLTGSIYINK